jgi:hypothetical protein
MVKAGLYDPLNPNPLRKTYLLWVERYLISRGVTAGEVWHTLQSELWPYRHPLLYRLSKSSKGFSLSAKEGLRRLARRVLPAAVHQWLRNQLRREII